MSNKKISELNDLISNIHNIINKNNIATEYNILVTHQFKKILKLVNEYFTVCIQKRV